MINVNSLRLRAAQRLCRHLGGALRANLTVRLWDGSRVEVGRAGDSPWVLTVSGSGTLAAIARRPGLETILREYVAGRLDVTGGDLVAFFEQLENGGAPIAPGPRQRLDLMRMAWPLLLTPNDTPEIPHAFPGKGGDNDAKAGGNEDFVRFHYDVGNDFYRLFLDDAMVYSCAYFTDWSNTLDQAQRDKLDMICRKLRLAPGDRFLDIGCGWGALVLHAAHHYDVVAHGITLSHVQHALARDRIAESGLGNRCTVEVGDYTALDGTWDKIASIGMYEHVRIANYPTYFSKLNALLRDRGLLLNHGITRPAKNNRRDFQHVGEGNRLIRKYIFPGSELDHIGHTLESMEGCGFEIHDVEGWREHYALTTRLWHRRLADRRDEAAALVGPERTRMWLAYLAGVSLAFADGRLQVFQTLASKRGTVKASGLPPTRQHLYTP